MKIAAAGNVEVAAFLVLKEKGYSISMNRGSCEQEKWFAKKDNNQFVGECPIELLGVVSVYESRGKDWKASDSEIDEFVSEFEFEA